MQDLQVAQTQPDLMPETITGNRDSSYVLPKHEQHLVHAVVAIPQFNRETGKDEGTKATQTFYPEEFARIEKEKGFAGMKVTILHVPEQAGGASEEKAGVKTVSLTSEVKDPATTAAAPAAPVVETPQGAGSAPDQSVLAVDPTTLSVKELIQLREVLYKDGKSAELAKADLIADIQEKQEFLKEEGKQ